MLKKWKSWRAERKARRIAAKKAALRERLKVDYLYIREETNNGLRWRRLREMPEIGCMHMSEGRMTFILITMNDGFEIAASDYFSGDAILGAAERVIDRIVEKYGLEEGEL